MGQPFFGALGMLSDCLQPLEDNRLTAEVFHGLVPRLGDHVDLILPHVECDVFWSTHR
jgi:hypothetical protein